jgi:hypothetical protein
MIGVRNWRGGRSDKRGKGEGTKVITISFISSTIQKTLALFTDKLTVGLDNTKGNVRRDFSTLGNCATMRIRFRNGF